MTTFVVLLGPPGAGKGTQALGLAKKMNVPHVSSGDIFRENLKNETELGKMAGEYIKKGELVPDDVTIAMIQDRLSRPDCESGALLDGFPRTPAQAKALDDMLGTMDGKVIAVPYIKVGEDELIARLTGRWTCPKCDRVYHVMFNPPKEEGKDDETGEPLIQRDDDQEATVRERLSVYHDQTEPLIDYYSKWAEAGVDGAPRYVKINGIGKVDEIRDAIFAGLGG